jgi:hypothetical protein
MSSKVMKKVEGSWKFTCQYLSDCVVVGFLDGALKLKMKEKIITGLSKLY